MTAVATKPQERRVGPEAAEPGRYEAFISYAREDSAVVDRLRTALDARGKG